MMTTQYRCKNDKRRQALRNSSLKINGIDYLEVLHGDAPEGTLPQCTLLVRMLKEAPKNLPAADVTVTGGVRVDSIKVEWVLRASEASDALTAGLITAAEKDYFLSLSKPSFYLVIRTDTAGDFSPYRLDMKPSGTLDPEQEFDPILSEVEFNFKVECPSDFDCQAATECPPENEPGPQVDYLAKDYASFRQLMLDRLAVTMPDWQERNAADAGIALVEALAYAGDYLSYYQDAAATEAYIGTARKRVSMRRHARLLDYNMHDGCNARTWVHFEVNKDNVSVKRGATQLLTKVEVQKNTRVATKDLGKILAQKPVVFETMHDAVLYQAHNSIQFYTWLDTDCCLPKGATRATLTGKLPNLKKDDVLIFVEERNPVSGSTLDADISHRHAVRLTDVQSGEDPLNILKDTNKPQEITEIQWMAADALPFALSIASVNVPENELAPGQEKIQPASAALGNIVLADHGRTVETGKTDELYAEPYANHRRWYLKEADITQSASFSFEEKDEKNTAANVYGGLAASELLTQNLSKAMPVIVLDPANKETGTWLPKRDLLTSDRAAQEFVVEIEDDGRIYLRFGDDVHGKKPAGDTEFTAKYRTGNGSGGNIGAKGIYHVVTDDSVISKVWNPLPARGGIDPESIEEVRQYAPQAFRTQERAVTEADYAEVAERHPEVQKAIATRRWTGSWHTMFLTIDRKGGFPVDDDFETELVEFLDKYRLAGQDLEIDNPSYVPLDIRLGVCVEPGYFRSDVKQALLEKFSNRQLSDGSTGFFHPDNFTFGQRVYLSDFVATAMKVPGVRWINTDYLDSQTNEPTVNRFQRWGQPSHGELQKSWIDINRLEIARLDNDPNAPENGKLEFFMEGGL